MTPDRLTELYDPKQEGIYLGFRKSNILEATSTYLLVTDGYSNFKVYKPEPPHKVSLVSTLLFKEITNRLSENNILSVIVDPRSSYKERLPVIITPITNTGIFRGNPYTVTEHIEGPTLHQVYNEGVGIVNMQIELKRLKLTKSILENNFKNLGELLNKVNTIRWLNISLPLKAIKYSKDGNFYITDLFASDLGAVTNHR